MTALENVEQLFEKAKSYNPEAVETFFQTLWSLARRLPKKESNQLAESVYEWAQQNSASHYRVFCLAEYTMGVMAWRDERYEDSLPITLKAQSMFTSINDEDGIAYCSLIIGSIYRSLGNIELGLKYVLEANQHLEKSGKYRFYQCISCYQLGEMYAETKHYEEALRMHERAIQLAVDMGDKIITALSLNGIAGVYFRQKKYEQVLKFLQDSLTIAKETGFFDFEARDLNDIGVYYSETGDFVQALHFLNQAHAIREKLNAFGGMVTDLMQMADIYEKQGQLDTAIQTLEKALKIAEDIKVKPKIFPVHEALSRIYQAKGEAEKSLIHYKLYHEIREEVEHIDAEKRVKNLQLIFEAEQTKKENVIIRRQKQEIEKKNIELQQTIDELTITKISRKAKALTLVIAVVLLLAEEPITNLIQSHVSVINEYLGLGAKILIVLMLKPIENAIEHFMLKKTVLRKNVSLLSAT